MYTTYGKYMIFLLKESKIEVQRLKGLHLQLLHTSTM